MGDTVVNVPVIVRDWQLLPMDLMEVDGEFLPFTSDRVAGYGITSSPFSDITMPGSSVRDYGQNIARLVIPPLRQGGMVKTFSDASDDKALLTAKLVRSFTKPELNSRLMPLDNRAYANYKKHGTFDVLMGVIKGRDGEYDGVAQVYGDDVVRRDADEVGVMWVRRPSQEDANRGFGTVLAASGRSFDPALIRLPVKDMVRMYSNESGIDPLNQTQVFIQQGFADGVPIADVDHVGQAGHDIGVKELNVDNLDPTRTLAIISGATGKGDGAGFHTVRPERVIQCLYSSPDMANHTKGMIGDYDTLIMGDKFYGTYIRGGGENQPTDTGADASVGGIGAKDELFLFTCSDSGKTKAFGPMNITSRTTSPVSLAGTSTIISQFDGIFGVEPVMVQRSPLFQDISMDRSSGIMKLMLPDDYKLVRVSQSVLRSPESPSDVGFIAKLAHQQVGDWMEAWSIDGGATISLDMPPRVKTAYQKVLDDNRTGLTLDRLEPKTAEFIVIAAGVARNDALEFVKEAAGEPITAYGISYLPTPKNHELSSEKRADLFVLRRNFAHKVAAEAMRINVFKLAADIANRQTVDAILGLGLANEKNVDTMVDSLPKYEEALRILAMMLKDARISGAPVEEPVLQKAMVAIENYIEQAKAYKASASQVKAIGAPGVGAAQLAS
jgi:hypothetical protein